MTVWYRLLHLGLTLAALSIVPVSSSEEPCQLPEAWIGQWYWAGDVLNISRTELGSQRLCVIRDGIKLLIQQERTSVRCYTCVVVFVRHVNVIEFKESRLCGDRPSLRQLCRTIGGDAPLHTMMRVRPAPVECPFSGRFTFSYRRSERVCAEPPSRAWSCADPSRVVLQHQACPDVAGAERLSETLTCLATWRNHDTHFLVGRLDSVKTKTDADRYRCFIYERFEQQGDADDGGGYQVVQSGDSTCQGLQSVYHGHKVISLYDDRGSVERCQLPDWLSAHREWHSMDGTRRYLVHQHNQSIRVTHRRRIADSPFNVNISSSSSDLVCSSVLQSGENFVKLVFHRSHDCTSGYQCALLYKREGHVVELKLGEMTHSPDIACQFFDESRHNFSTLVASGPSGHPCPHVGRHVVIGVRRDGRATRDTCPGGTSALVLGCGSSDTLRLRSQCRQRTRWREYRCHGHWQEGDVHFLVTSSMEESPERQRRVCFISMATSEGLVFSTLQEACHRNLSIDSGGALAFNVTIDGDCRAEASITRSAGSLPVASGVCYLLWLLMLLR